MVLKDTYWTKRVDIILDSWLYASRWFRVYFSLNFTVNSMKWSFSNFKKKIFADDERYFFQKWYRNANESPSYEKKNSLQFFFIWGQTKHQLFSQTPFVGL